MTANVVFGIVVLLDLAILGVVFLLGLGFAGHSTTYSTRVVLLMLPSAGVLATSVVLFVLGKGATWQGVAFVLALAAVPVLGGTLMYAKGAPSQHMVYEFDEFTQSREHQLEKAIKAGDFHAVTQALPRADVNAQSKGYRTALTIALEKAGDTQSNLDILQAILKAGADTGVNAGKLPVPLELAIKNSPAQGIEPMMILLNAGAKPNLGSVHNVPAYFAATQAGIDVAVIKALVARGADVTLQDKRGQNAADYAMGSKNWPVALYLLENGAAISGDTQPYLAQALKDHGGGEGLAEVVAFVKKAAARKK